ncbi:MAG TPA: NAD-dependent malic enzyme, partial [Ilumatobacteraceae bacterium]|nr:NAD-dependent malic enzyme [Ilumatobacteraceae bacterium]
ATVVGKPFESLRVVIVGAGAAGLASAKLLHGAGVADVIGVDREGILHPGVLTPESSVAKWWFAEHGNREGRTGC